MRAMITFFYVVMGAWLIFASGARIAIQLSAGQSLDALPFIGGVIGLIALVLLVPAYEDRKTRRHD